MPPRDVMEEVAAWIKKAESDLKNISLVLPAEDAPFDTVAFHAQQAAEKYLKALLTFYGVPSRRTLCLPIRSRPLAMSPRLPVAVVPPPSDSWILTPDSYPIFL